VTKSSQHHLSSVCDPSVAGTSVDVGSVSQWLGRRSLAGTFSLIFA